MLIKATQIIGLPVYTLKKGRDIDKVKDVIYDPKVQKVEALLVDPGGWFSEAKVIPINEVKSIGEDAVMVESDLAVKSASEVNQNVARIAKDDKYLSQTKVMTTDGRNLGVISDILFNPANGMVEEVELSEGPWKRMASGQKTIKVGDIVTYGDEITIINKEAVADIELQAEKGGIIGKYKQIKEDPRTQKLINKTKNAGEKIQEQYFQSKTSRQARNFGDAIKLQGVKLGEAADKQGQKLKNKIKQQAEEYRNTKKKNLSDDDIIES